MGSVFRRGQAWYIRYDLPPGPDGRRRERMLSCRGKNRHQADQELRKRLVQIDTGAYVEPAEDSLAVYLNRWIEHKRSSRLADRTIERYAELIRGHIVPTLGNVRLDRLRSSHIQDFYAYALTHGRMDGVGGLSPKTVRHIHGVLHAALEHAVRLQILQSNPVALVECPRVPRSQVRDATAEEIARLLPVIERSRYRLPILIALGTGLRRGEVCGLRWEDFRLMEYLRAGVRREAWVFTVQRSAQQTSDGRVSIKNTKTGRARVVMLPDFVIDELQTLRKASGSEGWICTARAGEILRPKWFGNQVRRLARSAGLTISLHNLRHSQATILLMAGVPVNVVQEREGHANASTTLDMYAHVVLANQELAIDVLNRFFTRQGLTPACSSRAEQLAEEESERETA